jgi:hypothetical protein
MAGMTMNYSRMRMTKLTALTLLVLTPILRDEETAGRVGQTDR